MRVTSLLIRSGIGNPYFAMFDLVLQCQVGTLERMFVQFQRIQHGVEKFGQHAKLITTIHIEPMMIFTGGDLAR